MPSGQHPRRRHDARDACPRGTHGRRHHPCARARRAGPGTVPGHAEHPTQPSSARALRTAEEETTRTRQVDLLTRKGPSASPRTSRNGPSAFTELGPDPRSQNLRTKPDVVVCSPQWLAARCREVGLYDARHHLVVDVEHDRRQLQTWLESRVSSVPPRHGGDR